MNRPLDQAGQKEITHIFFFACVLRKENEHVHCKFYENIRYSLSLLKYEKCTIAKSLFESHNCTRQVFCCKRCLIAKDNRESQCRFEIWIGKKVSFDIILDTKIVLDITSPQQAWLPIKIEVLLQDGTGWPNGTDCI